MVMGNRLMELPGCGYEPNKLASVITSLCDAGVAYDVITECVMPGLKVTLPTLEIFTNIVLS